MPEKHDFLLRGGVTIDVTSGQQRRLDVAFKNGRVAAVGAHIPRGDAVETLDVTGTLVLPGLIDFHGHFAHRLSPYGADPDLTCLATGVTTAVDAGSLGWTAFPAFKAYVIQRVATRLFAFLYLGSLGTVPVASGIPDLADLRLVQVDETIKCMEQNTDVIVGVKVRLAPTGAPKETAVAALKLARRVAAETRTRVMVHVMDSPLPLANVFEQLEPGDVVTHIFHGTEHGILDTAGRLRREVRDAHTSGILFDTACFMRHFSLPICRIAIENGIFPHFVSTDWVGPWMNVRNYNLLEVMSLFLELGMPLERVVACVSSQPAAALNQQKLGNLGVGGEGDATVVRYEDGVFPFEDMLGNTLVARRRLQLAAVVKGGRCVIQSSSVDGLPADRS